MTPKRHDAAIANPADTRAESGPLSRCDASFWTITASQRLLFDSMVISTEIHLDFRYLARALARFAVATALALLAAAHPYPAAAAAREAPQFSLPDLNGRKVSLSSLRGRVVVLNFWATWCGPCQFEIPRLAAFWRRHRDHCLEVLGVVEDFDDQEIVGRAAGYLGIPYPVLLNEDGTVADRYRVPGFPRIYLIDARGKVRRIFDGVVTDKELEAAVRPLLPASSGACSNG